VTAEATLNDGLMPAGNVLLTGTQIGIYFNPVPDRLRIIGNSGQSLRVNVDSGVVIVDGSINQPAPSVHAAAYTNNVFPAPATTQLFVIDAGTGSLLLQSPPNAGTLNNVGALSVTDSFTTTSGFDIAGGASGLVLAALQRSVAMGSPAEASRLYRINLVTGAASEIAPGVFLGGAGATPVGGLAIRVQ
jgi:hypothetical protein